jgi:Tol biopolymer transport system component
VIRPAVALVVLLVGASACQSESTGNPPSPTLRQDEAQVAVTRVVIGNPPREDIVLLTADGKVIRELVQGGGRALSGGGSWSPDGERFAYAGSVGPPSSEGEDETDIFVVEAAGSKPRRLTETGRAFAPVWSPDGGTIVFAEFTSGRRFPPTATIWSMAADGSSKRRLLDPESERIDVPSSFAPDGSRLAFTRRIGFEVDAESRVANTAAVYLLDMHSLEAQRLVDRAADGAFSPDGRRLAYVTDRDENGELAYGDLVSYANELYVLDVESGEARRVTETRDLNEGAPSWSPDGALLAFTRGEVVGNAQGTVMMTARLDGSCPRRIAFNPGLDVWYTSPVWRPNRPRGKTDRRCLPEPQPQAVPLAGNMSLAEARDFRQFQLYWLGPQFGEHVLSSISEAPVLAPRGRGPRVDLFYGDFQLQLSHACVRVPGDIDLAPERRMQVRGVDLFFYDSGSQVELVTGTTTITLFGEPGRLVDAIRALRPIDASEPPEPDDELPAPAPGALEGQVRC